MHVYNSTCAIVNSIPKFSKKGEKPKALTVKDFLGSFEDYMEGKSSKEKESSDSLYLKALLLFPDTKQEVKIAKD